MPAIPAGTGGPAALRGGPATHWLTITAVLAAAALVALTLTGTDPAPEPLPAQATAGLHPTWQGAMSALIVGAALLDVALVGGLARRLISTLTP